ncbi:Bax inhibitor-1/YccA family protein [Portibacter lacus]|uniref:Membrane protein n=1 Tax=Portibacter lacus TaxID=1099794 RepID=A0AA37SRX0_9BACT|nr:Bax inhibitor-1/YccA family protein [Portibacter lacus]GLR16998.1 membrane protein [Portibacter lacus]
MSRRRIFGGNNPMLKEETIYNNSKTIDYTGVERMTVAGSINKTVLLTGILMVTAFYSYANPSPLFIWGGAIAGLVAVLVASFKPKTSPIAAPLYAAFEGLFVGGISALYAAQTGGIIIQAVSATICVLLAMLILYKTGVIKVTEKLRSGIMMATGAILLVYVLSWVLGFMGINIPFLHTGGPIGIGISLVIIGVAAMNLLLDFDFFEKGEEAGMPSYMEWFAGMGLLVTLVWLYIEILRLLSILNRD